jgi:alcohol dehydrogenase (cytochrome c)
MFRLKMASWVFLFAGVCAGTSGRVAVGQDAARGVINVKDSDLLKSPVMEDWPMYNGDYTGRRYTGLKQVTPANASQLQVKWVFHTRTPGTLQLTPIVVAGVMFVAGSNDMFALDATTGRTLWHHTRAVSTGLIDDASGHINRGVAVLGTRVYMETDNAHLICLDARSGNQIWDVPYAPGNKNYGATSAPTIVKNKVLVGTSGGDDGVRGFIAAFDAETGKEVWRLWTIPAPGEPGSESWPGDTYLHGGATTWMPGTYDPKLNLLYWGTSNASPDFDGSVRPGDDLYTACVLAIDPDTGKLKWHFQFTPHDVNDYDAVETPILIDRVYKGQPRKLLVQANRNGFIYILDRTDGKFLFAKQFALKANWATGIDAQGKPIRTALMPTPEGTKMCPSFAGATNWYSPSYSEATKLFYFKALDNCSVFATKTEDFAEGKPYYSTGARRPPDDHGDKFLLAFDIDKGDFAWRQEQPGEQYANAGVMSTATGLIVFADNADMLEVADGRTGRPLWHFNVGQGLHASPMSYGVEGKQYFAIAAGSDLFAFGLP